MDIQEFRQKYPQYNDMPDDKLSASLHQKYYSDMPYEDFSQKFLGNNHPVAKNVYDAFTMETGRPEPADTVKPVSDMQAYGQAVNPTVSTVPPKPTMKAITERNLPVATPPAPIISGITRPFKAQAFETMKGYHQGIAGFAQRLDDIATFVSDKTGLEKGGLFGEAAKFYSQNADYWDRRAKEVGVNAIDEMVGSALGGAIPGITEFALNVPYSAMTGAAEAHKKGTSELAGAITEGVKRFTLGQIFHMAGQLKQPLSSLAQGGTMALQTAGEGGSPSEIAKSFGVGTLYGATSPGGNIGVREIIGRPEINIADQLPRSAWPVSETGGAEVPNAPVREAGKMIDVPPAPVRAVPEPPKPSFNTVLDKMQEKKTFEHEKITSSEKINAITLEEAGKLIAKGDPEVIHHIQEGVTAKGQAALQDAIKSEEGKVISQAHKGQERDDVIAKIQQIEPEINAALTGEVPKPQEPVKMSKEDAFKKALEAKANKALDVSIRHNGKVKTKRQMVDDVLGAGGRTEIKEIVDTKAKDRASELIVSIRTRGEQNIRAKDIEEAMRIIENPPVIKKYRLVNNDGSFLDISKTEYDYAATKAIEPEINKALTGKSDNIGTAIGNIIDNAKKTQGDFLQSKGMTWEDARALPKDQQAKMQEEYTSWLADRNKALTGEKKLSIGLQIDHPLSKAVSEGLKEISTNPYIAQIAKNVGLKKVVVGKPYTFEFTQEGGVNKYGEIHLNPDAVDVNETFLHELGHMVTSSFDTEQSNRLVKAVSKHYDLLNKIAPGYMRDFAEGHPEEALAHFFSLFDKLPPDVQSIMLEKPNKPRTYQVRPTEAGKVPVNLKPKKIESWDKMRETGGYIDPDHDLQGIINKYGDTWLGIKDVNGGRHMMKASDFIKLEQNEVAYNYVRSVYTVADGYTGKKEFRLDPDITRLTFAKAVAEVFPDKVDKFPDNIKKNPEFIKALKGNKAEVPPVKSLELIPDELSLLAHYKAKGLPRYKVYDQFIRDTKIDPENIKREQLISIYDSLKPLALTGEVPPAPAPKPTVEPIKIQKSIPKLTPSQRKTLELARNEIATREMIKNQGLKDTEGYYTGETLTGASMYPEWFKNKGYTKEGTLKTIDQALSGKPLTPKQQLLIEDINQGIREEYAKGFKESRKTGEVAAWDLKEGDKLKRAGEVYTVKKVDDTGYLPEVTIKNSDTITLKGDETLKYDRGTLKKGEVAPVPPPHSVAASLEIATKEDTAHKTKYRILTNSMPDGTNIGGWIKQTIDNDVFWLKGKRQVTDVLTEVGQNAVDNAINKIKISAPPPPEPAATPPAKDYSRDTIHRYSKVATLEYQDNPSFVSFKTLNPNTAVAVVKRLKERGYDAERVEGNYVKINKTETAPVPPPPEVYTGEHMTEAGMQNVWRGKGFDAQMPNSKIKTEAIDLNKLPLFAGEQKPETEVQQGMFGTGTGSGVVGFQPKGLFRRQPSGNETVGDIQRRSTIVSDLSKMLDVPIRTGKFKEKALGIFKVKPDVIRSREALDIETISHEVGHHLHKEIFGITTKGNLDFKPLNAFRNELEKIATKPRGGQSKLPEGFAEFTRLYITNESRAKVVAPKFFEYFDNKLTTEYPEVKEVLLKAREDYNRWLNQPASARILSQISVTDKTSKGIRLNDIYTATIDDLHPLNEAVKEMTGGKDISNNPYILARLSRGWWGKVDNFLDRGTLDYATLATNGQSLKEVLKPIANDLDNFRVYAVAKRSLELMARGKKTGILRQDAAKVLSELTDPKYNEAWQGLQKYQDNVLRYLKDSGIMSDKLYGQIKEMNKDYIPFYRVIEDMESSTLQGTHKFANLFQPVKKIKGSTREIIDPLESVIKNTYSFINIAERNSVGKSLADLAEKTHGAGKYVEKLPTPISAVNIGIKEALDSIAKAWGDEGDNFKDIISQLPPDMQKDMISIFRPSSFIPKDEPIVTVWKDGKRELYRLDNNLYDAMLSLNREQSSWLVRALSFPAKLLRAGATLTPEFSLRNPFRDQFTATIQSKYGFVPGVDFVRGLYHLLKQDNLYWQFKASGAEHSMLVSLDRDYLQKNLKDLLSNKSSLIPDEITPSIIKHPIELLRVFSELGEMSTRLGEFAKGVKREGITREGLQKAAFASRELTIDFARLGSKTQLPNMIVAFWNARLQGLDKVVRTFKDNPIGTTAKTVAMITLPSIALWLANKDDPRYHEIPQWQKDLFWIVMTDNHIYRIPKPFELGILFGSFPERILDYEYNKDPKAVSNWTKALLQGLSPGFVPTVATPIIENYANWSMFTDRPIVPKAAEGLAPEYQTAAYTSELSKKIGSAIGYSPSKIDNLIRGYTGGLGTLGVNAIDKIMNMSGIVNLPPQPTKVFADIPGLRAFIVRYPSANSESIKRFYDEYNKSSQGAATYKYLVKSGDMGTAQKYLSEHRNEIQRSVAMAQIAKDFTDKHKLIQGIYNSRDLTSDQKRSAIDKIYLEQIAIAQKVMQKIQEAK